MTSVLLTSVTKITWSVAIRWWLNQILLSYDITKIRKGSADFHSYVRMICKHYIYRIRLHVAVWPLNQLNDDSYHNQIEHNTPLTLGVPFLTYL
jgi:hypothetical protein